MQLNSNSMLLSTKNQSQKENETDMVEKELKMI